MRLRFLSFKWFVRTAQKRPPPRALRPSKQVDPRPCETVKTLPRKAHQPPKPQDLVGKCWVVDGDTIIINKQSIRLFGIDAPELDHPYGIKSKYALVSLCKGKVVTAQLTADTSYERLVAKVLLPDGTDVAAELVKQGLALDWPKYSGGVYKHLEPPGVRKKLWRAAARQRGRMPMNAS